MPSPKKPIIPSLFWKTGVAFILIGVSIGLIFPRLDIDIQLHDTYLIIGYGHVLIAISLLYIISWASYMIVLRGGYDRNDDRLIRLHYWITLCGSLIFMITNLINSTSHKAVDLSLDQYMDMSIAFLVIVLMIVIMVQLIPFILILRRLLS